MIFGKIFAVSVAACTITIVLAGILIKVLKRMDAGQNIREDGPEGHLAKAGTPTMGGLAMAAGIVIASATLGIRDSALRIAVLSLIAMGLVGFIDDYLIVVKKTNLGLTAKQKLIMQAAGGLIVALNAQGEIFIPLISRTFNLGILYVPLAVIVVVGTANAVNITDGLDGLASSVTAVVAAFFAFASFVHGSESLCLFFAAMSGACVGFLFYNRNPAKMFMGDTGSLALGGGLAAGALMLGLPLLLVVAGGIYVAETISVIIQVYVFKTQGGRRFFRMAPLHHHFELGGWSENKVVLVFSAITLALCLMSVLLL